MSNNLSLNSNKNNSFTKNSNRNNSNNYNNRRNSGGSNKNTLMVLAIAFIIILLVFAIVMIIIYVKTKVKGGGPDHREKILQKLIHDCNNDPLLVRHVPASSDFNEYSLSFWLYVKNTDATIENQGQKREIITKGEVIGGVIEDSEQNELDIYMDEGESTLKLFFGFNKAEGRIEDPGCINVNDYLSAKINKYWQKPLPIEPSILGNITATGATVKAEDNLFFTIHKEFELSFNVKILKDTNGNANPGIGNNIIDIKTGPNRFLKFETANNGNFAFTGTALTTNIVNITKSSNNNNNIKVKVVGGKLKIFNNDVLQQTAATATEFNLSDHKEHNNVSIELTKNSTNPEISNFKYIKLSSSDQVDRIPSPETIIDGTGTVKDSYKPFDTCRENNKNNNYFGMVDYRYYKDTIFNKETAVSRCIKLNNDIKDNITSTSKLSLCKGISDGTNREKTGPVNMGSQEYMYVSSTSSNQSQKPCELKLMPLEKWNHITVNVHGNICDLFFDGKLYRTCVLAAPPILNNSPIIIGNRGGFNGYVSNVVWSNKALNPGDIHQRYLRGPRIRLTFRERLTYFFSPNKKSKILQGYESEQAQYEEEQKSQSRV